MVQAGIIGAGRIGRVHMESLCTRVKQVKLKTIADPFMSEETAEWAGSLGVEHTTKDYREILEDPEITAVLICSSTDTHADLSVEAVRAGKHVFCEKPVARDPAKVREVMEALREHPVKYQVGFNRRFDHNFQAVRAAVQGGKIGEPQLIRITSRDPEPPPVEYIRKSGGIFLDMTIHDFDMVRYLAGCDALEVYAEAAVLVDPAIGEAGDADTAVITLKMENGALAVIDNSRQAAYGYDQRAEVFGSGGMILVGNDTLSSAVISTASGVRGEKPLFFFLERYLDSFAAEIRSFVDAVEQDRDPAVGIADGLASLRMGLAAGRSLAEHRPVRLSEIRD